MSNKRDIHETPVKGGFITSICRKCGAIKVDVKAASCGIKDTCERCQVYIYNAGEDITVTWDQVAAAIMAEEAATKYLTFESGLLKFT